MASDLLTQGFELMLVGMGTVFVFLTVLVYATMLMSRVVGRFLPAPLSAQPAAETDAEEVAAITAAIALHRRRGR